MISTVAFCILMGILAVCFIIICYAAINIARHCDDLEEQLWEEEFIVMPEEEEHHKDDE